MFFGCGEAGLISQAIAQFGGWGIPGVMLDAQRKRPVTRFYSNPDPVTMAGALARSDLEKTRFIFVSKSGDVSTVCQALAAIEAVRQSGHGDQIPHLFLTITGNPQSESSNGLHRLSQHVPQHLKMSEQCKLPQCSCAHAVSCQDGILCKHS